MIEFEVLDDTTGVAECAVKEQGCRSFVKRACLSCGALLCDGDKCSTTSPTLYDGGHFVVCKRCNERGNGRQGRAA